VTENITIQDIEIQKIADSHKNLLRSFQSYEKELAAFLVEDALDNQAKKISTTYLWFYKPTNELVGYVTVLSDAINLSGELKEHFRQKSIVYKSLPALKVGRMCVADSFLRRGIGTLMMEFIIVLAKKIGNDIGLRFLTTEAKRNQDQKRDSFHFYQKMGFEILKQRTKGVLPMYKDLLKN